MTKIELDGQPSVSLLQNVHFSEPIESDDGSFYSEASYDYFLPAKALFVEVTGNTRKHYDLSFLNKGERILLDAQLFARQIDALICMTDDSSLHFISKTVLDTMART